ncbi:RluA family pseudouridine synthase [Lacticaseibacillus daqingensis]|uniref:RluA family pseudouridine synthase n=1 Tax=Lacticaseibacillus daqingensis TaxID=2486014 RepID=UPI000F796BEC|nr:RluA family pseudouridine synthase [Lacticaseibacillus daqingensis]
MSTFTLTATAPAAASVRTLLTQWRVPKKWRHVLRTTKLVRINGQYRNFNEPVTAGEIVTLQLTVPAPEAYRPDAGPLTICYEDAQLLIVAKPIGMKPHPNQPGETGTLMNRVAAYLAPAPAFITHRLDMATSGLTLIAKDPLTQAILNQQLGDKTMARTYTALVPAGIPNAGTITGPIGRDPADKRKRMVRPDGAPAVTHYTVIARTDTTARVRLTLETGRTHQLRVHLASIGFPILGDPLYAPAWPAPRLMLHASALTLLRPLTATRLTITSPVPF